jgi:hypothetical protein
MPKRYKDFTLGTVNVTGTGIGNPLSVIAGVAGQKFRVYRMYITSVTAATAIVFYRATTALTTSVSILQNQTLPFPYDGGEPYFIGADGEAFQIGATAASVVTGFVEYIQAP